MMKSVILHSDREEHPIDPDTTPGFHENPLGFASRDDRPAAGESWASRVPTLKHGGRPVSITLTWPDPEMDLHSRGRYLCEGCWDAMTDLVIPALQSPTGLEMALCAACQAERGELHEHAWRRAGQ